jgi:low temperature requirement protein LtrA
LELFFDLVFVLVITQLSQLLLGDLTPRGAAEMLFLLVAIWVAWVYTTWWTNSFDPNAVPVRLVILVMLLAGMMMALAIPEAWGDRALLFALSYVGLHVIRNGFAVVAAKRLGADHNLRIGLLRLFVWSVATGALWIAGAIAGGRALVVLWIVALSLEVASPYVGYWVPGLSRQQMSDRDIDPGHFAERFQLFIIIVLGESIVITGATAAALELTTARMAAVVIAVAMASTLWWLYFNTVAARSSQDFGAASDEQARLARDAYSYTHILLVLGIMLVAIGNELVIAHPLEALDRAGLIVVVAGPVLYLLGHAAFAWIMTGRLRSSRLLGAALVVGVGVAAALTAMSGLLTQTIILAILVGFAVQETLAPPPEPASPQDDANPSAATGGVPTTDGPARSDDQATEASH